MPYIIKPVDDGYKVCKKFNPSKCFSKEPLPLTRAKKQMKAIGISEGGSKPVNIDLYNKVKEKVYEEIPQHSLYRSARVVREYKKKGGKYEGKREDGIPKWFKQEWISLNDFLRGLKLPCGSSNAEKYHEKVVCKPIKIAEKLSKKQMKKLIDEKTKQPDRNILTEDVLNTDRFNVKDTLTGLGKFDKQLERDKINKNDYLEVAKYNAKIKGYDPKLLDYANDGIHKLSYDGTRFGRVGYNDFLIYLFTTDNETAFNKRKNYRKRAYKVMKETNDRFSPASLSYEILW